MKRIQYHHYGGPEEMVLETYELPAPGSDEIVVRVKASSVNPVDWKIRQGAMKFMTGRRLPRAMGTDFSGVVDINPTAYKFVRSLYSLRHRFVFSNQGTDVLQTIADMARSGKLHISIGRTVKLDEAIALIGDLEAGRRAKGKAVIAMP
jgi:NADPH:quinone reductase-like Zn-dependent oxidoreductase